jgi:hypothetical protein
MITADQAGAGLPVCWTTTSWINAKPCFLIAGAVLFPVLIALSLPRSQPSRTIPDTYLPILPVTANENALQTGDVGSALIRIHFKAILSEIQVAEVIAADPIEHLTGRIRTSPKLRQRSLVLEVRRCGSLNLAEVGA